MWDKMLLNGAAGPDDELWGLKAPFGFGVGGRPAPNGAKLWGYCHLNLNRNPNLDLNLVVENGLRLRL
jgi:hypothetical protein